MTVGPRRKAANTEAVTNTPTRASKPRKAGSRTKSKPARSKPDKIDHQVVFAFRLAETDRKRIHDAAGSAKASRFVLAAALAAADGDIDAFKRVVESRTTK